MLGRELLTPDETRKLDNSECILLIRGCDPIIDKKYNTFAHSRFSETEDGGAAPYIHDRMAAQKQAVQILSEESLDYYKKKRNREKMFRLWNCLLMKFFLMSLFLRRFFGGRAEREPEGENGRGGEAAEENGKTGTDRGRKTF